MGLASISFSEKINENSQIFENHWLSKTWHYDKELALYAIFKNKLHDFQFYRKWYNYINFKRVIPKWSALVLILSNIVISDKEANIKIATEVQMVNTCKRIKNGCKQY